MCWVWLRLVAQCVDLQKLKRGEGGVRESRLRVWRRVPDEGNHSHGCIWQMGLGMQVSIHRYPLQAALLPAQGPEQKAARLREEGLTGDDEARRGIRQSGPALISSGQCSFTAAVMGKTGRVYGCIAGETSGRHQRRL